MCLWCEMEGLGTISSDMGAAWLGLHHGVLKVLGTRMGKAPLPCPPGWTGCCPVGRRVPSTRICSGV